MNVETKTFTTSGSNGSATATGSISIDVPGLVHAIGLDFTDQPNTVDVTITGKSGKQLFSRSNSNADGVFYPRLPATKPDATASALTEVAAVERGVDVSVAGGDSGKTVAVTLYVTE